MRAIALAIMAAAVAAAQPLTLHPDNSHYFAYRGRPAVLVTSGEHYGAVLNGKFDYRKYLETLAKDKLNLTRIFTGLYREVPASFGIMRNTLAPEEPDFVQPFRRVAPGRYDLSAWNDAYFQRMRDFVAEAGKHGIVVEVTLFTSYYNDTHWSLSQLNAKNNVQGIGNVNSRDVLTLKEPELVRVQERFVRKLVNELREFGNIYYEICNEPYVHGPSPEWQRHMIDVVINAEKALPVKHLISINVANHQAQVKDPHPGLSIFNFHYARPPVTVGMNYHLNKAIGMNETGFDGTADFVYRIQAWDFLLAGGALYNNLDYSFTTGHEDGTFPVPGTQPGGGSPGLRQQLRILLDFFSSIPFTSMRPLDGFVSGGTPEGTSARALGSPGNAYALYLHHGRIMEGYRPRYVVGTRRMKASLQVSLPAGSYQVQWWNRRKGPAGDATKLRHDGGTATLNTPEYSEDLAVTFLRR